MSFVRLGVVFLLCWVVSANHPRHQVQNNRGVDEPRDLMEIARGLENDFLALEQHIEIENVQGYDIQIASSYSTLNEFRQALIRLKDNPEIKKNNAALQKFIKEKEEKGEQEYNKYLKNLRKKIFHAYRLFLRYRRYLVVCPKDNGYWNGFSSRTLENSARMGKMGVKIAGIASGGLLSLPGILSELFELDTLITKAAMVSYDIGEMAYKRYSKETVAQKRTVLDVLAKNITTVGGLLSNDASSIPPTGGHSGTAQLKRSDSLLSVGSLILDDLDEPKGDSSSSMSGYSGPSHLAPYESEPESEEEHEKDYESLYLQQGMYQAKNSFKGFTFNDIAQVFINFLAHRGANGEWNAEEVKTTLDHVRKTGEFRTAAAIESALHSKVTKGLTITYFIVATIVTCIPFTTPIGLTMLGVGAGVSIGMGVAEASTANVAKHRLHGHLTQIYGMFWLWQLAKGHMNKDKGEDFMMHTAYNSPMNIDDHGKRIPTCSIVDSSNLCPHGMVCVREYIYSLKNKEGDWDDEFETNGFCSVPGPVPLKKFGESCQLHRDCGSGYCHFRSVRDKSQDVWAEYLKRHDASANLKVSDIPDTIKMILLDNGYCGFPLSCPPVDSSFVDPLEPARGSELICPEPDDYSKGLLDRDCQNMAQQYGYDGEFTVISSKHKFHACVAKPPYDPLSLPERKFRPLGSSNVENINFVEDRGVYYSSPYTLYTYTPPTTVNDVTSSADYNYAYAYDGTFSDYITMRRLPESVIDTDQDRIRLNPNPWTVAQHFSFVGPLVCYTNDANKINWAERGGCDLSTSTFVYTPPHDSASNASSSSSASPIAPPVKRQVNWGDYVGIIFESPKKAARVAVKSMDKEPGLQHKWMKDSGEAYLKKTKADVHGSQIKFEGDAVFQLKRYDLSVPFDELVYMHTAAGNEPKNPVIMGEKMYITSSLSKANKYLCLDPKKPQFQYSADCMSSNFLPIVGSPWGIGSFENDLGQRVNQDRRIVKLANLGMDDVANVIP